VGRSGRGADRARRRLGRRAPGHAEELPFPTASFDLVASRLAFHHFSSTELALAETARVSSDMFLLEDMLYVDERVEEAETLRDPSHGRCYSLDQWGELFSAAGLAIEATEVIERQTSFSAWLERCNCTGETAEKARELLSHRLSGDNYTSTVFLIKGLKGTEH
jgi:SAM-dependent methyltransferase